MKVCIPALLAFSAVAVRKKIEDGGTEESGEWSGSMGNGQANSTLPPVEVPDGFECGDDNTFTVMNWNVYLMDKRASVVHADDGQNERPEHIASYISQLAQAMCIDVVVFEEAWQNYDVIIDGLKTVLPYNTAGWMQKSSRFRVALESGGVFMLSRHPFEFVSHWFPYTDAKSEGHFVYKGFGVVRVQKGNRHHWVAGTHAQSFVDKHATRRAQMEEMKKTIWDQYTQSQERDNDPWYFAGDFNMDYQDPIQGKGEVEHLMSLFDLKIPDQSKWKHGNDTWPKENLFNNAHYPETEKSEWLDFVFHNNAEGLKTAKGVTLDASYGDDFDTKLKGKWIKSNVLSDHRPVLGRFDYHFKEKTYSDHGLDHNLCTGDSDCDSGFCRWSYAKDEQWARRCRPSEGWGYGRKCWKEEDCREDMYCSDVKSYCWDK